MRQLSWEADEYALGHVDSSQLPMIAAQALARGIDSPALGELAGLGRAEVREAGDLFAIAMAELGQPLCKPQVVLWDRASQTAQGLLDGIRNVGDAIDEIAWLLCKADHKLPDGQHDELATDFEMLRIDWTRARPGASAPPTRRNWHASGCSMWPRPLARNVSDELYEPVLVENDWYDGPRNGVAYVEGVLSYFESSFADIAPNEPDDIFLVWPARPDAVDWEREQWAIFAAMERAPRGRRDRRRHPSRPRWPRRTL